jgi:hypothetical protein
MSAREEKKSAKPLRKLSKEEEMAARLLKRLFRVQMFNVMRLVQASFEQELYAPDKDTPAKSLLQILVRNVVKALNKQNGNGNAGKRPAKKAKLNSSSSLQRKKPSVKKPPTSDDDIQDEETLGDTKAEDDRELKEAEKDKPTAEDDAFISDNDDVRDAGSDADEVSAAPAAAAAAADPHSDQDNDSAADSDYTEDQ